MCSCAGLQSFSCTALDVDGAVRQSNTDWLTSEPEQGRGDSSPGMRETQNKHQRKNRTVDTSHCFYYSVSLFESSNFAVHCCWLMDQQQHKQEYPKTPSDRWSQVFCAGRQASQSCSWTINVLPLLIHKFFNRLPGSLSNVEKAKYSDNKQVKMLNYINYT